MILPAIHHSRDPERLPVPIMWVKETGADAEHRRWREWLKTERLKEMRMSEPVKALSIRQPWAHLIIHAGKNIENRVWASAVRGKVLIHAAKTMTKADYEACVIFCSGLPDGTIANDFCFPTFEQLKAECGGIVGAMHIADCVQRSDSPWFCGPWGFVIDAAASLPFQPCKGELGFFNPQPTTTNNQQTLKL